MLMELLKQSNNAPLGMAFQVSLLYALTRTIIPHEAGVETVKAFKTEFPKYMSL
jgi:F0F1-type ATP synthase alpha subunit